MLSYRTTLVETVNIFNNFNFNWPAGLHLWSNYKSSSSSSTTTTTSWTFFIYALVCWIVGPSIHVPLLEEQTREYSSPYKVGLINVGTKFAQSRLVWFAVAYGKLNFHGTVILARRFAA